MYPRAPCMVRRASPWRAAHYLYRHENGFWAVLEGDQTTFYDDQEIAFHKDKRGRPVSVAECNEYPSPSYERI